MNSIRTDNCLRNWNTEVKNRILLYLEQPVIFKNIVYPPGEVLLLSYICQNPGITSTQLADTVERTRGTISIAMKKMIDKGLIYFKDAPDHRKRKLIFPTQLGEDLHGYCIAREQLTMQQLQSILTDKYSTEEMNVIFSALSDVIRFTIHNTRRKDL